MASESVNLLPELENENPIIPHCVVHETETCEHEEADIHKHDKRCQKSKGHEDFIPFSDFALHHLPDGLRDTDLFDLIQVIGQLIVKIEVRLVSPNRPDFWPSQGVTGNKMVPYPFKDMRGHKISRMGTGRARVVTDHGRETSVKCQCKGCVLSGSPKGIMGKISLSTATHVVFDELEAQATVCKFFYDSQDSPVVCIDGWKVEMTDLENDRCRLKCTTCNGDLVRKLHASIEQWKHLWTKVNDKYHKERHLAQCAIMVSHPHGCPKQVSVGKWTETHCVKTVRQNVKDLKFCYTTATCPGSSGAPVYILGYDGWFDQGHCGVGSTGVNISGVGRFVV